MGKYGMWVNMAWYLHEMELGLNNKQQDIFMDKKIKALFFDIDGTLVSFKSHRIPQSTVDALEQAKENGVSTEDEARLLAAHGILHLLGFDHQTEEEYNFVVEMQNKALEYALGEEDNDKV